MSKIDAQMTILEFTKISLQIQQVIVSEKHSEPRVAAAVMACLTNAVMCMAYSQGRPEDPAFIKAVTNRLMDLLEECIEAEPN